MIFNVWYTIYRQKAQKGLIKMVRFDKQLTFSTKEYESFEDMMDEMFWNDMYMHQLDTYYIHDTNQNVWYSIERRFHYADVMELFKDGKQLRFDEVKDIEELEELEEVLLQNRKKVYNK